MLVTPLTASPIETTKVKPREATTVSQENSAGPEIRAAQETHSTAATPAVYDTSDISDLNSARRSTDFARSNILGNSNTALAAQANLDPATVLQLLAD